MKVLVVDDMATSRGLILQALDGFGVRKIIHTDNGISAMQMLKSEGAHLVISDYNMPQMDGLHLLQHIRHDTATSKIGFILITGRADSKIIETGQKLGMNNFLKKPFTNIEMRDCIEAVVGKL